MSGIDPSAVDPLNPTTRRAFRLGLRLLAARAGTEAVYLDELARVADEILDGAEPDELPTRVAILAEALLRVAGMAIECAYEELEKQGVGVERQDLVARFEAIAERTLGGPLAE